MAHKYSNFDAAFEDLCGRNSSVRTQIEWGQANADLAVYYAGIGDWENGIICAGSAAYQSAEALLVLIDKRDTEVDQSHFYESIYWANKDFPDPPEAEIDMDMILVAMMFSNPSQIKHFIGLVDAFRAGIWDAPFEAEYFASLVRLYKQWV